jgi:dUTP pyrophosphatase
MYTMSIEVKIKKLHPDAVIPTYAKLGDAGMDLSAVDMNWDEHGNFVYHTGLSMEIPEGYVGLLFPRSSISKTPHHLRNAVGVIDSGYRGEIMVKFGGNSHPSNYTIGDRIAQIIIMPFPEVRFVEVLELSETERAGGGFGSTGAS